MAFKVPNQYRDKTTPGLATPDDYGTTGFFVIPHYKINGYLFLCMVSDGMGWEHVSISIQNKGKAVERCPTWAEMCWLKDQFWDVEDCVVQYHPPKSQHISMHNYCLHLWRPTEEVLPMPDKIMVGI